jgi:hypothetical protein
MLLAIALAGPDSMRALICKGAAALNTPEVTRWMQAHPRHVWTNYDNGQVKISDCSSSSSSRSSSSAIGSLYPPAISMLTVQQSPGISSPGSSSSRASPMLHANNGAAIKAKQGGVTVSSSSASPRDLTNAISVSVFEQTLGLSSPNESNSGPGTNSNASPLANAINVTAFEHSLGLSKSDSGDSSNSNSATHDNKAMQHSTSGCRNGQALLAVLQHSSIGGEQTSTAANPVPVALQHGPCDGQVGSAPAGTSGRMLLAALQRRPSN